MMEKYEFDKLMKLQDTVAQQKEKIERLKIECELSTKWYNTLTKLYPISILEETRIYKGEPVSTIEELTFNSYLEVSKVQLLYDLYGKQIFDVFNRKVQKLIEERASNVTTKSEEENDDSDNS